jgi:hypothetical protein
MSKPNQAPGGGDQQVPGGNADDKPNDNKNAPDDEGGDASKGKVSYETYSRVLDEKKALKKKVDEFEKGKRDAEEAKLAEQGNFKKLLEQREDELKSLKTENDGLKSTITGSRKMNAFLNAVTGEIPKQYLGLIDLEQIALDPQTGKPDEASVKKAARDFEKSYPDVVKRKDPNRLPDDAPKGGAGQLLSYDAWLKLPDSEKASRMKDVDKTTMN